MMNDRMLEVHNASVAYGEVYALRDFSCAVTKGSITALMGSNGAGKTTFLRGLSGLLPVNQGQIFFKGTDITRHASDKRVENGLVMVPEGRLIFADFTTEQNLKIGAITKRARGSMADGLERSYELFPKLRERRHQRGGTLSGGEQQMLAIARGLMSNPDVLMLDEPTLGLAPQIAGSIFEMIQHLRNQGLTILIVEQDVKRTLQIADHAYVLENGSHVLNGPAGDVLNNPKVKQSYLGL